MRTLIIFLATGAFAGYVPIAPGTAGSVVGLISGMGLSRSALATFAGSLPDDVRGSFRRRLHRCR